MAGCQRLERVKGIEPSYEAWEAAVLPLNYTRSRRHSRRAGRGAAASPIRDSLHASVEHRVNSTTRRAGARAIGAILRRPVQSSRTLLSDPRDQARTLIARRFLAVATVVFAVAALLVATGTMTGRLDRLEKTGLIRRIPHATDRRALVIELTPHGREMVDQAIGDHLAREHEWLSAITNEEREQLVRITRKLLAKLSA